MRVKRFRSTDYVFCNIFQLGTDIYILWFLVLNCAVIFCFSVSVLKKQVSLLQVDKPLYMCTSFFFSRGGGEEVVQWCTG